MDVHPPRKLVQVRADAGKLADALFFQRGLPQPVVQGALPDEVRHGLALSVRLGGDGFLFRRGDAQLYPGRAILSRHCGFSFRLHGFCLSAFSGGEGRNAPASPRQWTPRSVWPQRVGWLLEIAPGFNVRTIADRPAGVFMLAVNENNEIHEVDERSPVARHNIFRYFRFFRPQNIRDNEARAFVLRQKKITKQTK
jgi:hypothetical protein